MLMNDLDFYISYPHAFPLIALKLPTVQVQPICPFGFLFVHAYQNISLESYAFNRMSLVTATPHLGSLGLL